MCCCREIISLKDLSVTVRLYHPFMVLAVSQTREFNQDVCSVALIFSSSPKSRLSLDWNQSKKSKHGYLCGDSVKDYG